MVHLAGYAGRIQAEDETVQEEGLESKCTCEQHIITLNTERCRHATPQQWNSNSGTSTETLLHWSSPNASCLQHNCPEWLLFLQVWPWSGIVFLETACSHATKQREKHLKSSNVQTWLASTLHRSLSLGLYCVALKCFEWGLISRCSSCGTSREITGFSL